MSDPISWNGLHHQFCIKLSNNKSNSVSCPWLLAYSKQWKVVFYYLFSFFYYCYFVFALNFLHLNRSGVNVYALNRSRSRSGQQSNYNHLQFCKKTKQKCIKSWSKIISLNQKPHTEWESKSQNYE